MKKCQFCDSPATIQLTDIIKKKRRVMHLCEACAHEHNLIPEAPQELNVPALLQFLMGQALLAKSPGDPNSIACPHCGIKYAQFRTQGRLGCPEDYEVFRAALQPLLERIHRHTQHTGKTPRQFRAQRDEGALQKLRQQLEDAVRDERYEDAARLRDRIQGLGIAE